MPYQVIYPVFRAHWTILKKKITFNPIEIRLELEFRIIKVISNKTTVMTSCNWEQRIKESVSLSKANKNNQVKNEMWKIKPNIDADDGILRKAPNCTVILLPIPICIILRWDNKRFRNRMYIVRKRCVNIDNETLYTCVGIFLSLNSLKLLFSLH